MSTRPGLRECIVLLAVVPTVVHVFLEANVKVLIIGNHLRLYNAVDLLGMSIFYHLIFTLVQALVLDGDTNSNPEREGARGTLCLGRVISSALYTCFQVKIWCRLVIQSIHI